jgi:8-oxo-dGTP pyrophosphatase MutT (NUDIX family)
LARELLEELGIVPVDPRVVSVLPEPQPESHGPGQFHVYLVKDWIGEPCLKNSEHDRLGWFTLAEAAGLDLADISILELMRQVLDGSPV